MERREEFKRHWSPRDERLIDAAWDAAVASQQANVDQAQEEVVLLDQRNRELHAELEKMTNTLALASRQILKHEAQLAEAKERYNALNASANERLAEIERLKEAIRLLYGVHAEVRMDTPEDEGLRQKALALARALVPWLAGEAP